MSGGTEISWFWTKCTCKVKIHKTSWNTMFLVNPSGLFFKHTARRVEGYWSQHFAWKGNCLLLIRGWGRINNWHGEDQQWTFHMKRWWPIVDLVEGSMINKVDHWLLILLMVIVDQSPWYPTDFDFVIFNILISPMKDNWGEIIPEPFMK